MTGTYPTRGSVAPFLTTVDLRPPNGATGIRA